MTPPCDIAHCVMSSLTIQKIVLEYNVSINLARRVSRGGGQGTWPPLEVEKQTKKRSFEQILSYFTYVLLLF